MASFRYIVEDVNSCIPFYRDQLGFEVKKHAGASFAALERGDLQLFLNAPGAGGAGKAGGNPKPGGWNRIQIKVDSLDDLVAVLSSADANFRGNAEQGKGGKQILLEDPSGNLIELFEPKS